MVTDGLIDGEDDRTIFQVLPAVPEVTVVTAVAELRAGPRVVLLGSGELDGELEIALRRFGAEVNTVDRQPEVSTTDADELVALIRRLQPDFVVASPDAVSRAALDAL